VTTVETNIDGLVGPTHNYAGLSFGNLASEKNALSISNPRHAALQGLEKMKLLHDLGIPQMVMPPQPRPNISVMRQLGYKNIGSAPTELLYQIYSASSMWVANAATVSPSTDTRDGKVHITPANLLSKFHRALEVPVTAHYLKEIFFGSCFVHHEPLPAHLSYGDEGAANHMRLAKTHSHNGTEIFVYGGDAKKYPARQTLAASEAIARLHMLEPADTIFLKQCGNVIDAGVFHNDVIAMSNEQLFVYHEYAYEDLPPSLNGYTLIPIREKDLAVSDAVNTYFFNSQVISLPHGGMAIIAPQECENNANAKACFDKLISEGHIQDIYYLDLRESMKNGGGPACLRLRVPLNEGERKAVLPTVWFNDKLYNSLCEWIKMHYRDRIGLDDLRDEFFIQESQQVLAGILKILGIRLLNDL
jgi:succinylarginine dihydrolase